MNNLYFCYVTFKMFACAINASINIALTLYKIETTDKTFNTLIHVPSLMQLSQHDVVRPLRLFISSLVQQYAGTGRRWAATILYASNRCSKILFTRAHSGASGNAVANMMTNPNWMTKRTKHAKTNNTNISLERVS